MADIEWAEARIDEIKSEIKSGQMKQKVAIAFASVPRVMRIYHYLECLYDTFAVFTEGDQYDDVLMDKLLDVELELIKELPEIEVNYIPAISGEMPSGCIPEYASRIYNRETD